MYKVLLVDDEVWVVESLKTIIDWEEAGYKIIGQAYNGIEALDMIIKEAPDVVFTDIRMPDMNGLELIKRVNDLGLNIYFVVASGYAEFAYAQKAMNYGAVGYCLKPFDEMEIMNCLKKTSLKLREKVENLEPEIIELIECTDIGGTDKLARLFKEIGFETENGKLTILASIGKGQLMFRENTICLTLKVGVLKRVYIVQDEKSAIEKHCSENNFPQNIQSIGIANTINGLGKVKEAVSEAICSAYTFFITGETGVYDAKEYDYAAVNDLLKQLRTAVSNKDFTLTGNIFKDFRKAFEEKTYNIKIAFQVYIMTVSFIIEYLKDNNEMQIENYEQMTHIFGNIAEMFDYLERLVLDHIGIKTGLFSGDVRNETVRELIDYVNSNFTKEISIQCISGKFFVNPNYISRVFKKEVGESFIEYLTRLRVQYASRLLKETSMPVQQVSEKAGYNDYFYFTKIFKKATGKTPSQFRNV